jgi:hypothetical protein
MELIMEGRKWRPVNRPVLRIHSPSWFFKVRRVQPENDSWASRKQKRNQRKLKNIGESLSEKIDIGI